MGGFVPLFHQWVGLFCFSINTPLYAKLLWLWRRSLVLVIMGFIVLMDTMVYMVIMVIMAIMVIMDGLFHLSINTPLYAKLFVRWRQSLEPDQTFKLSSHLFTSPLAFGWTQSMTRGQKKIKKRKKNWNISLALNEYVPFLSSIPQSIITYTKTSAQALKLR